MHAKNTLKAKYIEDKLTASNILINFTVVF